MRELEKILTCLDKAAPRCPKCQEAEHLVEAEINGGDEVVATYECKNAECGYKKFKIKTYRRMLPAAAEKLLKEAPQEEMKKLFRQERAAEAARIPCGHCGGVMSYKRTKILTDGRIIHEYRCENPRCLWTGGAVNISFCDEDIEKIERRAANTKWVCPVCKAKETAHRVICKYKGGEICEEHCEKCEYRDRVTSLGACLHPEIKESSRRK